MDIGVQVFREFPVVIISHENTNLALEIEKNVGKALEAKRLDSNTNIKDIELLIDSLVYQLYKLTPEEIAIIEGGK